MVFLFFLVVVPFAVLTMRTFKKPVREKNQEFRSEMENTQGAVAEMLEMIPVARAHGLQEVEISKMNTYLNRIVDRGYNLDLIKFRLARLFCIRPTSPLWWDRFRR